MKPIFINKGKTLTILALMSGTSHDGIDAALIRIKGSGVDSSFKLLGHSHFPFGPHTRKEIECVFEGRTQDVCRANFALGRLFAQSALKAIKEAGIKAEDVDVIASHGQTICHIPPSGKRGGSTLQIGESAVIARITRIPVVSDFRAADMATGGQGAPLVPYADYILFRKINDVRAVQNIGGIANVTVVTPHLDDVFAFDTGPGNCLIDIAMKTLFNKAFDRDGKTAARGRVSIKILDSLLSHSYFFKKPPKSTGREIFGDSLLRHILRKKLKPEDVISTLTHFTAHSIKLSYDRFILNKYKLDEVIVSGGGTKNKYLMSVLGDLLKPVKLSSIEEFGIPSEAKEAMSFAMLANETLRGRPSNLPGATGAKKNAILGKITLP